MGTTSTSPVSDRRRKDCFNAIMDAHPTLMEDEVRLILWVTNYDVVNTIAVLYMPELYYDRDDG